MNRWGNYLLSCEGCDAKYFGRIYQFYAIALNISGISNRKVETFQFFFLIYQTSIILLIKTILSNFYISKKNVLDYIGNLENMELIRQ